MNNLELIGIPILQRREKDKTKYPLVDTPEWAKQYFKSNPNISGMAIGGGMNGITGDRQVILNPYTDYNKDSVLKNERLRHHFDESNFKLPNITKEQMNKYKGTPYEGDSLNIGRTEASRYLSGDKHLLTKDQIEYIKGIDIPYFKKGNGIHIKNGKPLEKEDSVRLLKVKLRYSGDVPDKKFFNFWGFQKDNSDVADYFNSYINSEGFKRIINNQNKWWEQRHPYRKYYSNPDKGTLRWFDVAEHVEPNRYLAKMSTSLSEAVHIPASEEQRFLIVGIAPSPFYADSTNVEFHPTQSLGHEYAHGKAPFSLFGAPNFHTESALAEALDQNKNTKPGHDSRLLEKHADLWGMRYLFYKEGIYDSRSNEDITIELIQKLRDKYPNLRPFLQMNNEQLLFQLNHVAQNNTQLDVYYAKSGIKIKETNRGKFTEYCNGKVTQECIDKAKKSGNKKLVKRAVFALNSRLWSKKHFLGGVINIIGSKIHQPFGNRSILDNSWIPTKELKKKHLK